MIHDFEKYLIIGSIYDINERLFITTSNGLYIFKTVP